MLFRDYIIGTEILFQELKKIMVEIQIKSVFAEDNMLSNKGFDLWADGYDKSVNISDEDGKYPFAGYKTVLKEIS